MCNKHKKGKFMKSNLILIGFMGSGKSTVGKILAEKLEMKFLDTDLEIEKEQGRSVQDILEGEYYDESGSGEITDTYNKPREGYYTGGNINSVSPDIYSTLANTASGIAYGTPSKLNTVKVQSPITNISSN